MLLSLLPLALAGPPPGLPAPRPPCGTPEIVPYLAPPTRFHVPPPDHDDDEDDEKVERDAHDELPNALEGDNFVIKWGDEARLSDEAVEGLLEDFEYAWAVEIGEMGHPAPAGTDRYLFNVYIGDTGSGAPDGYGTSGYFTRDDEDHPMIVVSAETLSDADWARGTATHEFFHAIQDGTGRFDYSGESAWYWEATAMWIEGEVLPDQDDYIAFLFGYALLPHLPVYFFDYPDTGALQEYHQYGAMIFPRYLSEIAADADLVRDTWTVELGARTPQDAIATLLDERGVDFADAFGDFAARNATWDYADGDTYAQWMDWYGDYYRAEDHRVVAEVDRNGTDGVVAAPQATLPGRYAYNVVTLARPGDESLRVRFEGGAEGSAGSAADWRVTVVRVRDAGGPEYLPLPLESSVGEVLVENPGEGAVHLVVAAVPASARTNETFAWSYAITPDGSDVVVPRDDIDPAADDDPAAVAVRTCGYTPASGGAGALGAIALAAFVTGRRRRPISG